MARRGPKKKPDGLRKLEGNPGNVPLNDDAPQALGKARPPKWLSRVARDAWETIAPLLESQGCLAAIDAEGLGRYCQELVIYRAAVDELARVGLFETTPNGMLVQSPAINIVHAADKILRAYEDLFGMSPASRSTLHVDKPQADELADLKLIG